jgi:hypothetical protein
MTEEIFKQETSDQAIRKIKKTQTYEPNKILIPYHIAS